MTEIIPKNCQIPVQKAELKISNNYDIFPECISSKDRGITIQTHKGLDDHQVNSQVANQCIGLPAEAVGSTYPCNGSSMLKVTAVPLLTNHQSQFL